ncbi:DEAD/DEAH box helicase [Methanococcoides alaskense]|uniref:Superfamily II DNA or RNA helicase n=1 Tax=Methanococcoides alaskense TaxID=325778 RepID=A0AA90Z936_9EURY|nr:SNF2-related protein [Methanococcoides alaskense]MDA0524209.1 SNF2-related protein [Methanococcoides alaskense]MDR6223670.1 superfamily II DNA or RNA helicase [Methanococcoides alaskense]
MSLASHEIQLGLKVLHSELGEGVVIGIEPTGYITVFFLALGERQVSAETLSLSTDRFNRIIDGFSSASSERLEHLWLALEAEEIPLMESAATLTSAKVDLLPHQVTLVHRMANTRPKRFLIADEVGLGKTIEAALILREMASRGELQRAMMVVPAGLVENWRRELNDVFNLDFEVFGSEGDVTDRKSNAFAKHNLLIASVDTLKRPTRIKKILEAPPWDLVVFDEAHHLSVYQNGNRVKKTENFKLAEALRDHCRDLLLLSATPHQGDHFRFWMLIRLLRPELFESEQDMVNNRHRLNAVVIRRTKADACAQDGSSLFARRMVHTEGFNLSEEEMEFYNALLEYLRDGYNLAAQQGNKGRGLGFVMTIFQKIAASSFAAIRSTLWRRLLMITVQEAIERDGLLDVDGRNKVLQEARQLIHEIYNLPFDSVGNAQVDQILADTKVNLLKKSKEAKAFLKSTDNYSDTELAASSEESAAMLVALGVPEERQRIRELMTKCPEGIETKTAVLINALKQIWAQNPDEKVVIFATYLGTVETIKSNLNEAFPDKGVDVLKGGDHGAKTAAQKRFRQKGGSHVLVSTAAGREGINLQFARVLFNYDLPWNPMDLEQRIGRIHRYGQLSTAQVYNLISADTIEGKIFLLLEEKLNDIAYALGKVDEKGQVTEDLRAQVLGQLSNCLSYDRLYQDALADPTLKRTRQELEVAMNNANLAREVVFELFQVLDRFNLGDYQKFDDDGRGMQRLISFVSRAARLAEKDFMKKDEVMWTLIEDGQHPIQFTSDRERALSDENLELVGLEHPEIRKVMQSYIELDETNRAVFGRLKGITEGGLLTVWKVNTQTKDGQTAHHIVRIGMTTDGDRAPWLEQLGEELIGIRHSNSKDIDFWKSTATRQRQRIQELLHRELLYSGIINEEISYSAPLLAVFGIDN